jgi:Flp pilus assembly protein TadG
MISRLLRNFARRTEGVAAVEFAFILPVMLLMYLGGVEVSQAVAVDRKVAILARSLGDLVAQVNTINTSEVENIFNVAPTVMAPYGATAARMAVSSIWTDENGVSKVDWSATRNGTAPAVGDVVTLPTGLASNNSSIVMAKVEYDYMPPIGKVFTGPLSMSETIYLKPRGTDRITKSD